MKFDFSDTEFQSSAVGPAEDELDTELFYGAARASFGILSSYEMMSYTVIFKDNLVSGYSRLNCRNLLHCTFLNLRHASIDRLDTEFLCMLRYLDVSFSRISSIDLLKCISLELVLVDRSQIIRVAESVTVEKVYGTE